MRFPNPLRPVVVVLSCSSCSSAPSGAGTSLLLLPLMSSIASGPCLAWPCVSRFSVARIIEVSGGRTGGTGTWLGVEALVSDRPSGVGISTFTGGAGG